ncbi:MAG: hypothetical protein OEM26_16590, partial [Saprospiraceae bacterium]|nr:hypothetical protein [Saprospiraceae bacterium]
HGILSASEVAVNWLRSLPPGQIMAGFNRIFQSTPAGAFTANLLPDGPSLWQMVRHLFPDPLQSNHVKALFNIADDRIAILATDALASDPTLRTSLLETGFFHRIYNLDLPTNARAVLVEDLVSAPAFREAVVADEGLVRGWEVLYEFVSHRRNVIHLENTAQYLRRTSKSKEEFLSELDEFEDGSQIFLDELEDTPASGLFTGFPTGVWNLNPLERGREIEKIMGQNLHDNFPHIDKFNSTTGIATSIKSTDIFARSYSQYPDNLEYTWKKYVDDLAKMPSRIAFAGEVVEGYNQQVLEIVVPDHLTSQSIILDRIKEYAKGKGINNSDIVVIIQVFE